MDTQRIGRRAVAAWAGAALAAAGPLARLARAEESTKDKILAGCRDGGHSPVENRDGSYQCNLRDGGEIRCNTKDQCRYEPPKAAPGDGGAADPGGVLGQVVGAVQVVSAPAHAADPLTAAGAVLAAPALGITLVVAPARSSRRQGRRRRRR